MNEVIAASEEASSTLRFGAYQPSLIPLNLPLLPALLSLLAQFLKPFSCWFKERRWDSRKMLGSGGMPSSHSATVTALAVSIGLQEGVEGSAFAIAAILACVVMYDASGVRLHAGLQAELLNQIIYELPPEHPVSSIKPLRDSLGHTPVQIHKAVHNHVEEFFDPLRGTSTDSVGVSWDSDTGEFNSSVKVINHDSSRDWTTFKKFLMQRFPVSKLVPTRL